MEQQHPPTGRSAFLESHADSGAFTVKKQRFQFRVGGNGFEVARVALAGPTTLLALLNSLQMGFRTLAIQQRSAEVWRLLAQVKNDFTAFGDVLEKTQNRLRQASESIDAATRRTRSISRRLSAVETMEGAAPEALPPGPESPEDDA